ncbi:MAG: PQQ-binding-like beta-propeller repeat protein [Thermoplasmata archaeon]|nr:MAG: PQQ-binding-like beta-propeller repeat protein [Thermoplasmata archaeon]
MGRLMGDLEPVWEYKTDDNVWAACLSRDGQLLVLGSWDSIAYALDRTGEVVWRHKTSDYVKGISISDDGELTVVGSYDRYIYAIKSTGKLAWRYKTENYVRAVGVSADGEYVAAGSWRGTLYYLDKRGKLLWKQRVGGPVIDLAVSGDGSLVVAGCEDGSVHAYDSGGNEKWSRKAGGTVTNVAVADSGDKTLVAAKDTLLICINAYGEEAWRFHMGGSSKGLKLIQGGELTAVFTDNNFLQYVDPTGSLLFMRRLPEEIWEGTIADDGITVAVATKDNRSQLFDNSDLANVVLEACQQTLEKVISDNVDISEAQDMHRHAGELITEGQNGEAIRLALEAQSLAQKTHKSTVGDRATSIMAEVNGLIEDNGALDMRKALRYLEKAKRDMEAGKLERVIFYGQQAKAAAEETIDKGTPAVEDELFASSLGGPVDTDETAVDRMLGKEVPEEEPPAELDIPEEEVEPGLAEDLADEIGEEVAEMGGAEEAGEAANAEVPSDEGLETPPEEPEPDAEGKSEEDDRLEALGEPPEEIPVGLYTEGEDDEVAEPSEDMDEELQDVCPKCGEAAWDAETGECRNCISEAVMTFAVDEAKAAHKEGTDISGLTADLKAAKVARQEKDYDEVIAVSERIVSQLEEVLGKDMQAELAQAKTGQKKKKKKKRKRF